MTGGGGEEMINIMIDLDDVITDFCTLWIELYKEEVHNRGLEDPVEMSQIVSWEIGTHVKHPGILFDIIKYSAHKLFLLRTRLLPKVTEAMDILKGFTENGKTLYIASAYGVIPSQLIYKYQFIMDTFPWFNPNNIIFTNSKYILNVDFVIDDKLETMVDFKNNNYNLLTAPTLLLVDRPWNKDNKPGDIIRVPGLYEAVMEIKSCLDEREKVWS
jgi:5'(3')-deoxyribonucleotidase